MNAANAFGGRTGFKPVEHVISNERMRINDIYTPGEVFFSREMNAGYYLNCVRPDTERSDDDFGKAILDLETFDAAAWDRNVPVISTAAAPANET